MSQPKRNAAVEKKGDPAEERRILLLEDHSVIRQGLKELIDREPDLTVCGEAGDARSALDLVETLHPDLVLVDISLPGPNGIEFIKNLKSRHPDVPAAVLSMYDESLYAERALRAGALAYLGKSETANAVLKGIRRALKGQFHVSSLVGGDIFNRFLGKRSEQQSVLSVLSDRELEVFELLGRGLGRAQIATDLNLSPKTVDAHNEKMKKKLALTSCTQLARRAQRWVEAKETGESDSASPGQGNGNP